MNRGFFVAAVLLIAPFVGCGSDDPAPAPGSDCAEGHMVGDVCAGVPNDALCSGASCAPGGDFCTSVIEVSTDPQLQDAVAGATDGTCVVLAPGNYGSVTLQPVRMAIVGEHPTVVSVASVTIPGGEGTRMSGFATGSVTLDGGSATLDALRIENGSGDGVFVGPNADITITRSEISGHARYGVSAFDVGSVTLDGSVIELNAGPGIWLQSGDSATCSACDCASTVTGVIKNTVFSENAMVGISIVRAASVDMQNVNVLKSAVGDDFKAGGGVSVAYCSSVTAENLNILDSSDFGLLVHDASLTLDGGTIENNLRGVWIQEIGQSGLGSVTMRNTTVMGNQGVGIGIAEQSDDVFIESVQVQHTAMVSLPVLVNGVSAGAEDIGDGVNWLATSLAILKDVTVGDSARESVLIDGEVQPGSEIENLVLMDGDDAKGVLQQSFPASGTQPVTSGTSPQVMTDESKAHETPLPIVPPGI